MVEVIGRSFFGGGRKKKKQDKKDGGKILGKPLFGRWPKSKKEEQEYGPGKEGVVICQEGEAVYYKKRWRHIFKVPEDVAKSTNVSFELCPADKMKKGGLFEGIISVEGVPEEQREDVANLVRNVADRAYKRDVLDRILKEKTQKGSMEIETSENQLAIKIGKQIKRAYKNVELDIKLSEKESVARVSVKWPKE